MADFESAAKLLGVEVAIIRAVAEVESNGSGFLPDDRLVIRFEGHKFRSFTKGVYDAKYPTISHVYYSDGRFNKGVQKDYLRLGVAMKLDADAALKATSWGMFQIMGEEYWRCDCDNVHEFVDKMKLGASEQLKAFCYFVQSKGLIKYLKAHNWAAFALRYNGENYAVNGYHIKLADAYSKYNKVPVQVSF